MKGVVFTEFLELVEQRWGDDVVDEIIEAAELASGGAYTAVGTYPHEELVSMVIQLSRVSGAPADALVQAFGHHLFHTFHRQFPMFFNQQKDAVGMLKTVEDHIHVEVRKLYPDAELPSFEYEETETSFQMTYRSNRSFADLAHGLIEATITHYGNQHRMERHPPAEDGSVTFHIERVAVV